MPTTSPAALRTKIKAQITRTKEEIKCLYKEKGKVCNKIASIKSKYICWSLNVFRGVIPAYVGRGWKT